MSSGFLLVLGAIAILCLDCWSWCASGAFEPTSLWTYWRATGFAEPNFESRILQFAAAIILHFPISMALAVLGCALISGRRKA